MARSRDPKDLHFASDVTLCACKACGTLNDEVMEIIRDQRVTNANLADVVAQLKAANNKLRRDQDAELAADPLYQQAIDVLEHWSAVCDPAARELHSPKRVRPVLARLHGKPKAFTVAELKRCADGYAAFPYVIDRGGGGKRVAAGTPAQRYVGAHLVFGDAEHVQRGLRMADDAERATRPVPMQPPPRPVLTTLSELGQRAVALAEFGFHIFPLWPRSKTPVPEHGLLEADRDLDRIVRWWRANPDCNIGIRCGVESQLVVLDVDAGEGTATLRGYETRHGPLPRTASVVTPRGGSHFYFRHPSETLGIPEIGNTAGERGALGPGLDFRGDGGYVVSVYSIGPNGRRYEPDEHAPRAALPEWLARLLVEHQARRSQPADPAEWEQLIGSDIREGDRNTQLLRLGGHLWNRLTPGEVHGILQNVNQVRCRPPLSADEVSRIVASIGRMREREARAPLRLVK